MAYKDFNECENEVSKSSKALKNVEALSLCRIYIYTLLVRESDKFKPSILTYLM